MSYFSSDNYMAIQMLNSVGGILKGIEFDDIKEIEKNLSLLEKSFCKFKAIFNENKKTGLYSKYEYKLCDGFEVPLKDSTGIVIKNCIFDIITIKDFGNRKEYLLQDNSHEQVWVDEEFLDGLKRVDKYYSR